MQRLLKSVLKHISFVLNYYMYCIPTCLSKLLRSIYCRLFAWHQNSSFKRYLGRFLWGVVLTLIFWKLLLINFQFSFKTRYMVLLSLLAIVAVGSIFSAGVRCICLLIFVQTLGDAGRGYLRALCFTLIISGPIANIALNAQEVARSFSCSAVLMYNLTRVKYDLLMAPLQNFIQHVSQHDIPDIEATFSSFKKVMRPLRNEIESSDPGNITFTDPADAHFEYGRRLRSGISRGEEIQQRYKEKFKKRCLLQMSKGKERCRKVFERAHDNCEERFPFIVRSLLCWPFKLDVMCEVNIFGNPNRICDPKDALPNDFGNNFAELEAIEKKFTNENNHVQIKVNVNNLKSINDTGRLLIQDIKDRTHVFDRVMYFISRILSFFFIRLVYDAIRYEWKYMHDLDHDNIYITDYFKHVDERQKAKGKRSVLPLKKHESNRLIDMKQQPYKRSHREYRSLMFQFLQFALELTVGLFFLIFDNIIVEVLNIICRRSKITFTRAGATCVQFHVKGEGSIAKLLRSTLKGFNTHKSIYTYLDNKVCLPHASELPRRFYLQLLLLYLLVVFLIFCSTFFLRGQRLICAYFYRKREKRRILYLYSNLIMQRRLAFERFKLRVQQNATKEQIRREINLLLRLRLACPYLFNWLRFFYCARRKCVVCGDFEANTSIICRNCNMIYCYACIQEMDINCLVCQQPINMVNRFNVAKYFEELESHVTDGTTTQLSEMLSSIHVNSIAATSSKTSTYMSASSFFKKFSLNKTKKSQEQLAVKSVVQKSKAKTYINESEYEEHLPKATAKMDMKKQRKGALFCCHRNPKNSNTLSSHDLPSIKASRERKLHEIDSATKSRAFRRRLYSKLPTSSDTNNEAQKQSSTPRTNFTTSSRSTLEKPARKKAERKTSTVFSCCTSQQKPKYRPLKEEVIQMEETAVEEPAHERTTTSRHDDTPESMRSTSVRAPVPKQLDPETRRRFRRRPHREQKTISDETNADKTADLQRVSPTLGSSTTKSTSKSEDEHTPEARLTMQKPNEIKTKTKSSKVLSCFTSTKKPKYKQLKEEEVIESKQKAAGDSQNGTSTQAPFSETSDSSDSRKKQEETSNSSSRSKRFRRRRK